MFETMSGVRQPLRKVSLSILLHPSLGFHTCLFLILHIRQLQMKKFGKKSLLMSSSASCGPDHGNALLHPISPSVLAARMLRAQLNPHVGETLAGCSIYFPRNL